MSTDDTSTEDITGGGDHQSDSIDEGKNAAEVSPSSEGESIALSPDDSSSSSDSASGAATENGSGDNGVGAATGESAGPAEAGPAPEKRSPQDSPYFDQMRWYVVHAYSGFELKAKRTLEERVRQKGMVDFFGDIHVPQETVVELVRGQKKTSNRKFFPGYILVQMVLNEDTWHLVKETPKISGFVGDATDPSPLAEEEVARIVSQVEEGAASPRSKMKFEQGETVKVVDGPFADFNGTVEEVKPEKGKVRVLISIFGRATPVELDFIQVEKC